MAVPVASSGFPPTVIDDDHRAEDQGDQRDHQRRHEELGAQGVRGGDAVGLGGGGDFRPAEGAEAGEAGDDDHGDASGQGGADLSTTNVE
ncbi:hypothetical protein GCM10018954_085270 [Kutzneria kofuensis]